MAIITALTAARMLEIEAASIIDGEVVGSNLILEKQDGSTINAGNVRGPQGLLGPQGITGPPGPSTGVAGGVLSGSYPNPGFAPLMTFIPLALGTDWTYSFTTDSPPFYYKTPFGEVAIEGCIYPSGGAPALNSLIGTLDSGFRPFRPLPFPVVMSSPGASITGGIGSGTGIALVLPNGEIRWDPYDSSGGWVSLCGIRFRAD